MNESTRARTCDAALVFLLAFVARAAVVLWGSDHVPPTADGAFYHVVAGRIAEGLGYTWLWPDGAVTYAAHYPVGYPALLSLGYAIWGPSAAVGMWINALLGSLACAVVHGLCWEAVEQSGASAVVRRASLAGGLFVALSPTLVGYTPALMTEGVVGAFLVFATWSALRARRASSLSRRVAWCVLLGVLLGASSLLRPQSVLFAPWLGFWASSGDWKKRITLTVIPCVLAVLVCVPWTLRNCEKMERCVFVSANGGWNLLIGTFPEGKGAWVALEGERVPVACREVFQEAAKDACFGQAGVERIEQDLGAWLSLIPYKLRVTLDYTAAASDHLREAGVFDETEQRWGSVVEWITQRILFLFVLLGVAWPSKKHTSRWLGIGIGILALGLLGAGAYWAWLGIFALAFRAPRPPPVTWVGLGAVALTMVIHAAFFGAGRYSLPLLLLLAPAAAVGFAWLSRSFDSRKFAG